MYLRFWNYSIIGIPSKSTKQWILSLPCKGLMTLAAVRLGAKAVNIISYLASSELALHYTMKSIMSKDFNTEKMLSILFK